MAECHSPHFFVSRIRLDRVAAAQTPVTPMQFTEDRGRTCPRCAPFAQFFFRRHLADHDAARGRVVARGDDLTDHRVPGDLTDDEKAARGLRIGEEQQVLFGNARSCTK